MREMQKANAKVIPAPSEYWGEKRTGTDGLVFSPRMMLALSGCVVRGRDELYTMNIVGVSVPSQRYLLVNETVDSYDAKLVDRLLRLKERGPIATFDSPDELMKWLDDL